MEAETSQEYLDSLKEAINQMEPMDKACASVLVHLGRLIAELLNRRDYGTVKEMEEVCADLFKQAKEVRDEAIDTIQ